MAELGGCGLGLLKSLQSRCYPELESSEGSRQVVLPPRWLFHGWRVGAAS